MILILTAFPQRSLWSRWRCRCWRCRWIDSWFLFFRFGNYNRKKKNFSTRHKIENLISFKPFFLPAASEFDSTDGLDVDSTFFTAFRCTYFFFHKIKQKKRINEKWLTERRSKTKFFFTFFDCFVDFWFFFFADTTLLDELFLRRFGDGSLDVLVFGFNFFDGVIDFGEFSDFLLWPWSSLSSVFICDSSLYNEISTEKFEWTLNCKSR